MRTYTEEKPKYVQQGTYTETYHVKKWEDLTTEQKDEVIKHATSSVSVKALLLTRNILLCLPGDGRRGRQ